MEGTHAEGMHAVAWVTSVNPAHANKRAEMSHVGGSASIPIDCCMGSSRIPPDRLSMNRSDLCMRPRAIMKPWGGKSVLISRIACVDSRRLRHPLSEEIELCVESLSPSHNRETILSLLSLLESHVYFPHWLLWPHSAGLHVACWPVCTTLSLGERGD
jgi:hypothetical protein